MTAISSRATLIALPYDWTLPEHRHYNTLLLDEMVAHPSFYGMPLSPEQRRLVAAGMLTAPDSRIWGVWDDGTFVGVAYLSNIIEHLQATFHVLFLDHNLVGKRNLLERFLAYCLVGLDFRRLCVEVPEDADKLLRFYRILGFRYEGETKAGRLFPVASATPAGGATTPTATTIAKYGSRMEGVFWRNDRWIDVLRLRLLRDEWREESHASSNSRSHRSPGRRERTRLNLRPEPGHHHPTASQRSVAEQGRHDQPDALPPGLSGSESAVR